MSEAHKTRAIDSAEVARRLRSALDDPRWEFRTVEGIADEMGLQPEQVGQLLKAYPDVGRKSPLRSRDGRELYTGRRRPSTLERLERIRGLLARGAGFAKS